MKHLMFSMFSLCLLASCSSYSPKDEIERLICEDYKTQNAEYSIIDITKEDSINTIDIKNSIKTYLSKIETCQGLISNQDAIDLLIPKTRSVITDLMLLESEPDIAYRRYKLNTVNKNDNTDKKDVYANVQFSNGTINIPITISDSEDLPNIIVKFDNLKLDLAQVCSELEKLTKKSPSEIEELCKKEKERQEQIRIATEEAKKKAAEEAEANRPIASWNDVANIISKRGKVLGIWKNGGPYGLTLAIFQQKGIYYIAYCNFSKNPIDDDNIMRLKKKKENTFEYNQEGSDMPERFKINQQGNMDSYTFNPDGPYGPEWVYMGSYTRIY